VELQTLKVNNQDYNHEVRDLFGSLKEVEMPPEITPMPYKKLRKTGK
jgi:hypothetical protein